LAHSVLTNHSSRVDPFRATDKESSNVLLNGLLVVPLKEHHTRVLFLTVDAEAASRDDHAVVGAIGLLDIEKMDDKRTILEKKALVSE
jgi:hypothetical protein